MAEDRVIEIEQGDIKSYGSGFLITSSLAITALHVVKGDEKISYKNLKYNLRLFSDVKKGDFSWKKEKAEVFYADEKLDLALLYLDSTLSSCLTEINPINFGKVELNGKDIDTVAWGFPNIQFKDGKQDIEKIEAKANATVAVKTNQIIPHAAKFSA